MGPKKVECTPIANKAASMSGTLNNINAALSSGVTATASGNFILNVGIDDGNGNTGFKTFSINTQGAAPVIQLTNSSGLIVNAGLINRFLPLVYTFE